MWLTLSSYGYECIAAALKDQPQNRRELAQAVCRFEEVNVQGRPSYRDYRPPFSHGNQFTTVTLLPSIGGSSHMTTGSSVRAMNRGRKVLLSSSRTTSPDRTSLTSRDLHSSRRRVERTSPTFSRGALSARTRVTKLDSAPPRATVILTSCTARSLSDGSGNIVRDKRRCLT